MARKPAHQQFDTRQAIRDVAFDLFGRFGYDGVSIGALAAAAKLSKGALYWHYANKDALFLECLQRLHALFERFIFDPMQAEPDPALAITHLFTGVSALLRDPLIENGVAGFWLQPALPDNGLLAEPQRAFERRSIAAIRAALVRGIDAGRFDLRGDLDEMSRAILCVVEAVILPLRHQSPDEVQRTLGVLARTLFRAYDTTGALPNW